MSGRKTLTPEDVVLRKAAYGRVRVALRNGTLIRPDRCDNCGNGPAQAHHHNGYQPEHALDILWLCASCHVQMHAVGKCPPPVPMIVRLAQAVVGLWDAGQPITGIDYRFLKAAMDAAASDPKAAA